MTARAIRPHPFTTTDPKRGRYYPRCCTTCQLPETRRDIHALPATPAEITQHETRRLGERTTQT